MIHYMIIYGPLGTSEQDARPVSVQTDGSNVIITGPAASVANWANKFASSLILASSFTGDNVRLDSYAASNSMTDILFFNDEQYELFKDRFEAVKGSKRIVKITRIPTNADGEFSEEAAARFMKRAAKMMAD